ncbi:MAG TPA: LysR family transcriptional regulator, partial [Xanthobacteraceae bacterium]
NGSIVKAAEQLRVSQPTITNSLRDLERKVGARLLERNSRGVTLTEYGKLFIRHVEAALSEMNSGLMQLDAFVKSEIGFVSIGVPSITAQWWLPTAISRFKATHPDAVVCVDPQANDIILPRLRLGEIDFVVGPPGFSHQMRSLVHELLFDERICLVVRREHPLARKRKITKRELNELAWFVPYPFSGARDQSHGIFKAINVSMPRNIVEASWTIAADYLRQTDAATVLPFSLISHHLKSGELIELKPDCDLPRYQIGIIRREGIELTKTASALIREVRKCASGIR